MGLDRCPLRHVAEGRKWTTLAKGQHFDVGQLLATVKHEHITCANSLEIHEKLYVQSRIKST